MLFVSLLSANSKFWQIVHTTLIVCTNYLAFVIYSEARLFVHNVMMIGPPGAGKSMLAARLPGLMPPLAGEAAKGSAAVLSLVGQFRPEAFGRRPYRQPHHTASAVALVGGGWARNI